MIREQGCAIHELLTLTDWLHETVGTLRDTVSKLSGDLMERDRVVEREFDRMADRADRHRGELNNLGAFVGDLQDLAHDVQEAMTNVQNRLCRCGDTGVSISGPRNTSSGLPTPPMGNRDVGGSAVGDRDRDEVRSRSRKGRRLC